MQIVKTILIRFFADYVFAILVVIAGVILLRYKAKRGENIVRGVLAGISGVILDKASGLVYYHERPFVVLGRDPLAVNPANNSFPSDHSLLVFVAAFVVWASTKNWKLGIGLMLGGVAVGWARVLALVHWPIDIVGSFVMAVVVVAIWFGIPLPKRLQRLSTWTEAFIQRRLPKWLIGR
ncbi:MAG TPA: phosphatase PAP2 family protein [Candidatus Saccharimonadales bacterium]|nr:phosphatase PAP2 family protein [Candidatus Saccharimonadales bacterium]